LAGAKRKPAFPHLLESAAFAQWREHATCEKFKKSAKLPVSKDLITARTQFASHHSNE
jgi:hypothetical protein